MRQRKRKDGVQDYLNYENEFCRVVGELRPGRWKVFCKSCNKEHIVATRNLRKNSSIRECDNFRPHNKLFENKRDGAIRRQYGITLEQYDEMLEEQNYRCAICNNEDEVEGRRLAIDHCHTTGVVRGLLCGKCNRGIGLFYDSRELLERAINYLNKDNLVD